ELNLAGAIVISTLSTLSTLAATTTTKSATTTAAAEATATALGFSVIVGRPGSGPFAKRKRLGETHADRLKGAGPSLGVLIVALSSIIARSVTVFVTTGRDGIGTAGAPAQLREAEPHVPRNTNIQTSRNPVALILSGTSPFRIEVIRVQGGAVIVHRPVH